MGYWDATDQYLSTHGGCGPTCPMCGKAMFALDDHGRFGCSCGHGLPTFRFWRRIPQEQEGNEGGEKKEG